MTSDATAKATRRELELSNSTRHPVATKMELGGLPDVRPRPRLYRSLEMKRLRAAATRIVLAATGCINVH